MEINQSKLARQELGATRWKDNNGVGTLNYTMRFGKTYSAVLICQKMIARNNNIRVAICVPSEVVKNVWNNYIDDYFLNNNVVVFSAYQIINKEVKDSFDLLIFDEVHKFVTDKYFAIIEGYYLTGKFKLGLTGTFPIKDKGVMLSKYLPIVDKITEQEALNNGWVNEYVEYNLKLELSDDDKESYIKLSEPISRVTNMFRGSRYLFPIPGTDKYIFNSDYDVIESCRKGKKYPGGYIEAKLCREKLAKRKGWTNQLNLEYALNQQLQDYWSPEAIEANVKYFNDFVRKRTELISNNSVKLIAVLNLYKKFPVSTICFNESIDFAEIIATEINYITPTKAVCYHSEIASRTLINPDTKDIYRTAKGEPKIFGKKRLKDDVLNGTLAGRYKFISTAKALDEGLDIPNLEQVITTAGSANPTQYQQRNARAKTVDIYNPDKVARIINLYFDDFIDTSTNSLIVNRDKSKLISRQRTNNNEILFVESIDEIL